MKEVMREMGLSEETIQRIVRDAERVSYEYGCYAIGVDDARDRTPTTAQLEHIHRTIMRKGVSAREPKTEEILKDMGGINMNGEKFVVPQDIDKVIIRLKDGSEFEGAVTRSEYSPGPFGRSGYSELTVTTLKPGRTGQYGIKKVVFNNPATVVYWDDGTQTVVYCQDNMKKVKKTVGGKTVEVMKPQKSDTYSEEVGLAMALAKKHYGNGGSYNNIFRKFLPGLKEREKAEKKAAKKAKRAAEREEKAND